MHWTSFPPSIRNLEPCDGRFEATRLEADGCEVLFGRYPAGTIIEPHHHSTENYGVITKGQMLITITGVERSYGPGDWYGVPAGAIHWARCAVDTEEIEFWFRGEVANHSAEDNLAD
jgi:quercetin dioxygenase-like cupin family protein